MGVQDFLHHLLRSCRVELLLICRKCHPHPHQMYILNMGTGMEIINETIIAHQIIDMTILRLIEINNPEIIRMVLVFKTSNYNKHLTHVFVYFFLYITVNMVLFNSNNVPMFIY